MTAQEIMSIAQMLIDNGREDEDIFEYLRERDYYANEKFEELEERQFKSDAIWESYNDWRKEY